MEEGINFIKNNLNQFMKILRYSYLAWSDDLLLENDFILAYVLIENTENICILSSFTYISMGYVIATKEENKNWRFRNEKNIDNISIKNSKFNCNICNKTIDISKNKFYNRKENINFDNEINTFDLCIDCYKTEDLKNDYYCIDFSNNLPYFCINTFELLDIKSYTNFKQICLGKKKLIIKDIKIDLDDFKKQRQFSNYMFNSKKQLDMKDLEKYNSWTSKYHLDDLYTTMNKIE
jgi:hypothetical protein